MEATIYQTGINGATTYFLRIDGRDYPVKNITGFNNSLANEIRMQKTRLARKGIVLSLFHPEDLERRLDDSQIRTLESATRMTILEPPRSNL